MATLEKQDSVIQIIQLRVDGADQKAAPPADPPLEVDIEHAIVQDDPRNWSKTRKYAVVGMVFAITLNATLSSNLLNPAISEIQADLHASGEKISHTIAVFILLEGFLPLVWSTISEFQGRKVVYLVSTSLCTVGCIAAALSKTIDVLLSMRCLQAIGVSAVLSVATPTLADLYEPAQRGTMVGIGSVCAVVLGPLLGPIVGGGLTQAFGWRAVFWFLAVFAVLCTIPLIFFPETYRRERSLTYQAALRKSRERENKKVEAAKDARQCALACPESPDDESSSEARSQCVETKVDNSSKPKEVKISLTDVDPIRPTINVLRCPNNVVIFLSSGLLDAFECSIVYTSSLTLAKVYGYDALKIGRVMLSFGFGALLGSLLGGRYSDYVLVKMTRARDGSNSSPEMRLRSNLYPMLFLPASVIAYGWVCEGHVHVSVVCVLLFLSGFLYITIWTITLSYIIDANSGRSSSALSANSCVLGLFGFIASEIALPLENSLGNGGLYSIWSGLIVIAELLVVLVLWKGRVWRERANA
ncbi:hypothetical protein FOMPIDRAFT_55404 [Fomitopsis schrenkii]|uniref:Major facilitator superfamily (MFS) profile domain-containing protein n=1 Tax=Fomitopsis schrenkii TaxID=2126942 RepID=S8E6M3_FOMSC|nr:hypothetical protein FOMPIDRAFT_55404 [Fomitopsis schrenkii]